MSTAQIFAVASEISCPACAISVEGVADVELHGQYFQGPAGWYRRGRDGSFVLIEEGERVLKLFDQSGRFVRNIGRRGDGPGEYHEVRNVVIADDGSVHALDMAPGRWTRFSSDGALRDYVDVEPARGLGCDALLLADGQLLVNTKATPTSNPVTALKLVARNGQTVRQFDEVPGDGSATPLWRKTWLHTRLLSAHADGTVYSVQPYAFVIDEYDPSLQLRRTIRRRASWLPTVAPKEHPSSGAFSEPMTPSVSAAWIDSAGLFWLMMNLPHPEWKAGPALQRGAPPPQDEYERLAVRPRSETVVEAIDLTTLQVLARMQMRKAPGRHLGDGYFIELDPNAADGVRAVLSRVVLSRDN